VGKDLIAIADLSADDVGRLWRMADEPPRPSSGARIAWCFEGKGIRTRTSFIQAFQQIGASFVELPDLLKTSERACDLAGYLDPYYDLYVIRETDHERLTEFAAHSTRPVINAMSRNGHPCEVLADAYSIEREIAPLSSLRVGLWGPETNVFRSWQELAAMIGFELVCFRDAAEGAEPHAHPVRDRADCKVDVLITDAWPAGMESARWTLQREHLKVLGEPRLLPTPPFSIGRELGFDPVAERFVGYRQKLALLPVQRAVITDCLARK
jgi:ornithine carbamoyltransferase